MKFAAVAVSLLLMAEGASAHSWYSKRRDPVFNTTTCCNNDCGPVPSQYIHRDPATGALRIVMPLEAAKLIYSGRLEPVDVIIPFERLQPSEDGQVHICLQERGNTPRNGYWCVFIPNDG